MPKGAVRPYTPAPGHGHTRKYMAQRGGTHPVQLAEYARRYTLRALERIAQLAGISDKPLEKVKVLDPGGRVVEIDLEVPAATQLKALELLLNRGYGTAPQAIRIDVGGDGPPVEGALALTIKERIAALRAETEKQGQTTDLEASEVSEVDDAQPSATAVALAAVMSPPREEKNVTPSPQPTPSAAELV